MDAANAIGETNELYVAKQRLIIRHIQQKSDTIDLATVNLLTENVKMKKKT